jgi:sugar lactone lactonase YvrE
MKSLPLIHAILAILAGAAAGCNPAAPAATASAIPSPTLSAPTDTALPPTPAAPIDLLGRPGHIRLSDDSTAGYAYRSFLQIPIGTAWGPDGFLYAADWTGRHIVRIGKDGAMDDLPLSATIETLEFDGPRGVAFDSQGNLFFNSHDFIFRIDPGGKVTKLTGVIREVIGSVAVSPADELYYTDRGENGAVRKWTAPGNSETVVEAANPENLTFGRDGTLYFTQVGQDRVMKLDADGGTAVPFVEGACGFEPCFLAVDPEGDIWIRGINRLSQYSPDGTEKPFVVDGQAYPGGPYMWQTAGGIAFDDEGGLWVASFDSRVIRLAPDEPGKADPKFTLRKVVPGFQASVLDTGAKGELYATDFNDGGLWRIRPDGTADVIADWDWEGRAAVAVDEAGTVFLGMPNGEVMRMETDGSLSVVATVLTRRMIFGGDGMLYAIAGEMSQPKSLVRIGGDGSVTELATGIDGVPLGNGEAHISRATDTGLYIFTEADRNLFFVDFNGQGRLIANLGPLGGWRNPVAMTASPTTGDIFLIPHGPYVLHQISPDGKSREIGFRFFGDPWGMAVSRDGRWLYVAESGAVDKVPIS